VRSAASLLVLALALAITAAAGASGPVVTYTITSATAGDHGWYRSNVTVKIDVSSDVTGTTCPVVFTFHSSSETLSCSATNGQATIQFQLQFKIDTDAPTVTSAAPDRAPDSGGWYNHPLNVTFGGADATSGIASCTSASYGGPDSGSASVSGTCRDNAGNVSAATPVAIRYDATPPAVTAALSRAPDSNGWYSHAVGVSFSGTDGGSGIGSCTAPVSYAGPDSGQASVSGGCVDVAGNRASAAATFQYDSTAPRLASVAVAVSGRMATITWKQPADVAAVAITRTPGRNGKHPSLVFRGKASSFRDKHLSPGVSYRYEVASSDVAGNTSAVAVKAAVPALYAPAAGSRVRSSALLAWAPVKGASYYNVQVFRGTHKVLSAWPKRPTLRLTRTWTYAGKRQRLAPGRYRWFVWPGRGAQKAAHYGAMLGGSTFVVR